MGHSLKIREIDFRAWNKERESDLMEGYVRLLFHGAVGSVWGREQMVYCRFTEVYRAAPTTAALREPWLHLSHRRSHCPLTDFRYNAYDLLPIQRI
jgi:hypothetical protein